MKKALTVGLIGMASLTAIIVLTSKKSDEKKTTATEERVSVKNLGSNRSTGVSFADSPLMASLRAAVSSGDGDALDRAFKELVEYLNAHPEQVDDYVAILRNEQAEHVLRRFALALAESEAGLLENEKIIEAAKQLAKDSSFEQRQHIMLHLMSSFPEMREDVLQSVLEVSKQDPNPQVKTSGVVVLADWMENFPDKTSELLGHVGDIFNGAGDDEVRAFAYQVMALHKESLPPELYAQLGERFKDEFGSYNGPLIASALSAAPDEIRSAALAYVQNAFANETDMEKRRNLLPQIVFLGQEDSRPLLVTTANGDTLLAEDAKDYLALLSTPEYDPQTILLKKAMRDGHHGSCDHPEHQKN